jgi:hypothetical protein
MTMPMEERWMARMSVRGPHRLISDSLKLRHDIRYKVHVHQIVVTVIATGGLPVL